MSDIVIVALISAAGGIISSAIGLLILWKQKAMHATFNSKMDIALAAQRALGDAEGRLAEKTAQRIRDGEALLSKEQLEATVHK